MYPTRTGRSFIPVCAIASFILGLTSSSVTRGKLLGEQCYMDKDCELGTAGNSHCHTGYCRCLSFYAEYNSTHCLESTLLGYECLVKEQCSLKVANSDCIEGVCGCESGFLQFRRHTCLGPAKIGQICYEHAHCRLWEPNSHCDFLIPDLFGRCQCTAPMRRDGDVCRPDDLVRPSPFSDGEPVVAVPDGSSLTTHTESQNDVETGVEISWLKNVTTFGSSEETKLPESPAPSKIDSFVRKSNFRTESAPDDNDAVVIDAITATEIVTPGLPMKSDRHEATTITMDEKPVSLGLRCNHDLECRSADMYSRCIDGICDCAFHGNGSCNANNSGCAKGTFQCRASGICISWFFVCDGRADCIDGSDERCSGESSCPDQAFACKNSKICISRAGLCDGKPDCPAGEDEIGCNDRRKCPIGTFRCNNGQCLPAYEFCNAVVSCRDGSDEPRGACRTQNRGRISARTACPFRCDNGRCRSDAITCSGRDGCGDGSDESRCVVCRCPAPA